MRGSDEGTGVLFSYVDVESRIRRDHPLRRIPEIPNAALSALDGDSEVLYPRRLGRPSIPPERLLRAMLLQVFYGIRLERQLMERIEFDLLLDGTLIEAWASIKSFCRKDGSDDDPEGPGRNAERDFHKEKRSNETHQSTTDPEARLYTPHIAINGYLSKTGKPRATAMDRRTTRHPGYAISQCRRKRIEEVFGWAKGSADLAKVKLRGRAKVDAVFTLALAACNLVRLPRLLGAPA